MATCRCDHTEKAHAVTWTIAPSCQVVWCRCLRFRDETASWRQRWREWRSWRRALVAHERETSQNHRLGNPRR